MKYLALILSILSFSAMANTLDNRAVIERVGEVVFERFVLKNAGEDQISTLLLNGKKAGKCSVYSSMDDNHHGNVYTIYGDSFEEYLDSVTIWARKTKLTGKMSGTKDHGTLHAIIGNDTQLIVKSTHTSSSVEIIKTQAGKTTSVKCVEAE